MMARKHFTDCLANVRVENGFRIEPDQEALMLGLGITSRCNFNCPICFYHDDASEHEKDQDMSPYFLEDMLNGIGKLSLVNLALQGEPFVHPEFINILGIIGRFTPNIIICSNGSIVSDKICSAIENLGGLKLVLSVDASDAATYKTMRKGGNFEIFSRNASLLRECLGDRVELAAVVCNRNVDSLENLPKLAYSLDIRKLNLSLLRVTPFTERNNIFPVAKNRLDNLLQKLRGAVATTDIEVAFSDLERRKEKCAMPFFYTSILADGTIFPCCGDFMPVKVDRHNFEGIFNHSYLTSIRANLLSGHKMAACAGCF